MTAQDLQCLLLRACDLRLPPAARPSTLAMFDQKMAGADFALNRATTAAARSVTVSGAAVVLRHVYLELLGVRASGGFPSRFFGSRVEVVREVFGI